MTYQTIQFDVSDAVATLTLNRPDSLNSFNTQMHEEVRDALAEVHPDKGVRALLLTGAGRGFCAGQDLSDRKVAAGDAPVDLGETLDTLYNPLIRTLRGLPLPVVCAVNGVAAGAGANLALAADLVLAAQSAKFIQAFCKLGLIPDSGGTWILPRLVGPARAAQLALLGTPIDGPTAERWGLIYKCTPDAELAEEASKLCQHLATQPTAGLAAIKRLLQASWQNDLDTQLDLERDTQRVRGASDDYREGVDAFFAKRTPVYSGR